MRRGLPILIVALVALGQEPEEPARTLAEPNLFAIAMTDGTAPSKDLLAALGKVRGAYEEKPILFFNVNLATVGGRHQGEMLFSSLGIQENWDACRKDVARLIVVAVEDGTVKGKYGVKDDLGAALEKLLKPPEEGCSGESGCDEEEPGGESGGDKEPSEPGGDKEPGEAGSDG